MQSAALGLTGRFKSKTNRRCDSNSHAVGCTYVLIGGLVEGDQVGVEAGQSHYWPQGEETHQDLQHSGLQLRKQQQMFSAWHAIHWLNSGQQVTAELQTIMQHD